MPSHIKPYLTYVVAARSITVKKQLAHHAERTRSAVSARRARPDQKIIGARPGQPEARLGCRCPTSHDSINQMSACARRRPPSRLVCAHYCGYCDMRERPACSRRVPAAALYSVLYSRYDRQVTDRDSSSAASLSGGKIDWPLAGTDERRARSDETRERPRKPALPGPGGGRGVQKWRLGIHGQRGVRPSSVQVVSRAPGPASPPFGALGVRRLARGCNWQVASSGQTSPAGRAAEAE